MFKRATKKEARLRLAIAGPSGSGKTFTSLSVGCELGERVAVLDTERGSASKYADLFNFDVVEISPPYSPARYIEVIKAAQDNGYDVLIIDSLSHAWAGEGGVLQLKDDYAKQRQYNDYTAWGPAGKQQDMLINAIVSARLHIIATMRSKTTYVMEEYTDKSGRKKTKPVKIGMAPIQRDGTEYEFDVVMSMDIENNGIIEKTRCTQLTNAVIPKPGKDVAVILIDWLSGESVDKNETTVTPNGDKRGPMSPSNQAKRRPNWGRGEIQPKGEAEKRVWQSAKNLIPECLELEFDDESSIKSTLSLLGYEGIPGRSDNRLQMFREYRLLSDFVVNSDVFSVEEAAQVIVSDGYDKALEMYHYSVNNSSGPASDAPYDMWTDLRTIPRYQRHGKNQDRSINGAASFLGLDLDDVARQSEMHQVDAVDMVREYAKLRDQNVPKEDAKHNAHMTEISFP